MTAIAHPEQPAFDGLSDQFEAYYSEVRGYVRERVTRLNLIEHLEYDEGQSLSVLDIGGGSGRDAVWFASMGHHVRLIDPSRANLALARSRVLAAGLSELVTIQQGYPEEILGDEAGQYDVVTSHGVFMYVDDPAAHLRLLHDTVREGGIVSILTKGKKGSIERLEKAGKVEVAAQLAATNRMVNNLGEDVLAVDEEAMRAMLGQAGLHVVQWYGVRLVSDEDRRKIGDVPARELADILGDEIRQSSDERVRARGQMLHFICQKDDDREDTKGGQS